MYDGAVSFASRKRQGPGRRNARRWRGAAGAALGLCLGAWGAAAGCGARTGLEQEQGRTGEPPPDAVADVAPPTASFCEEKAYDSGPTDLSIFVVLDKSGSMLEDERWSSVAAAFSAFVDDPKAAGLGVGLLYYPLSAAGNCAFDDYSVPSVPLAKLPGNAAAVKASLAQVVPFGETPTLPALRGGIEYSRGVAIANPKERVVIALVTDGAPNACDSTAEKVAALEQEAATTDPKVLTYVIGLATGYTDEIALMASAGGTGKPILVDDGASAAQTLVDAMLSLKIAQEKCVFGVPIPPGAAPKATDLSVRYRLTPGGADKEIAIVADFASCSGEAFFPDDLDAPGSVTLCPAACEAVHGTVTSQVTVTAGCGMGTDGGLPDAKPDGAECPANVDFSCVPACGSSDLDAPSCVDGAWTCPPGTFSDVVCTTCPAVPHGCCEGDGTFVQASCVNGAWTCPPGSVLFGSPGCSPPAVCTGSLPCAFGSYCDVPDDSCGTGALLGTCKPVPAGCGPGGPAVCGCGGTVFASACEAAKSLADVDGNSGCNTPGNTFPCGGYFCQVGKQVCRRTTTLGAPVPDQYLCIDIPPGCGDGCGCQLCEQCPPGGPCGFCGPDGDGVYLECTQIQN